MGKKGMFEIEATNSFAWQIKQPNLVKFKR